MVRFTKSGVIVEALDHVFTVFLEDSLASSTFSLIYNEQMAVFLMI